MMVCGRACAALSLYCLLWHSSHKKGIPLFDFGRFARRYIDSVFQTTYNSVA